MNQHVRAPPTRPRPSVPARLKLVYRWVSFETIARDFARLFVDMHKEAGHNHDISPLDPDYNQYFALDVAGILRTLAVTSGDDLVGFALCTVGPHMDHMSTRWGSVMKLYLAPSARRGMAGQRMMREITVKMRQEGVKLLTAAERPRRNSRGRTMASLLHFNGFEPIETVFALRLE